MQDTATSCQFRNEAPTGHMFKHMYQVLCLNTVHRTVNFTIHLHTASFLMKVTGVSIYHHKGQPRNAEDTTQVFYLASPAHECYQLKFINLK
jgi:hypothetical protein